MNGLTGLRAAYLSRAANGRLLVQQGSGRAYLLAGGTELRDTFTACKRALQAHLFAGVGDHSNRQATDEPRNNNGRGQAYSVAVTLRDGSTHGHFCVESLACKQKVDCPHHKTVEAFADVLADHIESKVGADESLARLSDKIRQLIEGDQLNIVFQPIFDVQSTRPIGFEALSRFPDDGARSVEKWFSDAKVVGLQCSLEMEAIRSALRALPLIPETMYLALNASPELIVTPKFHAELSDVPDGRIVLEITEHDPIEDYRELKRACDRLRPKIRIAVDDAGAGHSSFRHVLVLRPDIIKLDAALMRGVDRDSSRASFARSISAFARLMGISVIAEGIETEEEFKALPSVGIGAVQGFFLAPPLLLRDAISLARRLEPAIASAKRG